MHAGCHGYLDVWPESPELDEQLWKAIDQGGWDLAFRLSSR